MKTMGFVISHKNNEKRRAILPEDIKTLKYPENLLFERGYGESLGYSDRNYEEVGVNIVDRNEVLRCDIITDVKLGDADYLNEIENGKILFGWAHAVQGIDFTSKCLEKEFTVIAWEEIFENGRYVFYRNREVAGEAAVLQAFCYYGKMPYECRVAIIGNGQTAKGALRVLHGLGANVDVYGRKLETLFRKNFTNYDVIVNCVMWDTSRNDRLIYKKDLKKMKPHSMIIDVSCDPNLEIETSHPTTIDNPVYEVEGIIHYAVDNTPAMFPITVTKVLSRGIIKYIDTLLEENFNQYPKNIQKSVVILNGHIQDKKVTLFRTRKGVFCC